MYDFSYFGLIESKLPAAIAPVKPREYMMCRQTIYHKHNYGVTLVQSAKYNGSVYDQVQYNMYCQAHLCADPQLLYAQETVHYNSTDGSLINYFCIDFVTILQQMLPSILANIQIPVPQWLIDLVMGQINVFHISWMEVLSNKQTLSAASRASVAKFLNQFPATSIGYSLTWMDLLYGFVQKMDVMHYSEWHAKNIT